MTHLLENLLKQYGNIIKNSFFLTVVDGIKLLLPFVAMPYIIRVCGVENYGKIIFAQTVITYFTIVVNFGLNIYTVREVARNAGDASAISRLASSFITLRLLLIAAGFAVLWLMVLFVPFMQQFKVLLFYAFIAVAAEAFTMTAFYQGMEKMHNIAILQFVAIIFYLVMLFVFVRSAGVYERVVLFQSTGLLIASLLGVVMLCTKYKVRLALPQMSALKEMVKGSIPFALSRVALVINGNVAKLFAGIALGMHELAVLDVAQKIAEAAKLPVNIADQAIYPHNARKKDHLFATRTFWLMLLLGCVCAALMALGNTTAVNFFGHGKLDAAVPLIYILTAKVILNAVNLYCGTPVLVAFGYAKHFNMSTIYSALLTVVLYTGCYLLGILSLNMVIAIMIFDSFFAAAYRLYYCLKYKLLLLKGNES